MSKENDLRGEGWTQAKLATARWLLEDLQNQSAVREARELKTEVELALSHIDGAIKIAYSWYGVKSNA